MVSVKKVVRRPTNGCDGIGWWQKFNNNSSEFVLPHTSFTRNSAAFSLLSYTQVDNHPETDTHTHTHTHRQTHLHTHKRTHSPLHTHRRRHLLLHKHRWTHWPLHTHSRTLTLTHTDGHSPLHTQTDTLTLAVHQHRQMDTRLLLLPLLQMTSVAQAV